MWKEFLADFFSQLKFIFWIVTLLSAREVMGGGGGGGSGAKERNLSGNNR